MKQNSAVRAHPPEQQPAGPGGTVESTFTLNADRIDEAYPKEAIVVRPDATIRDVLSLLQQRKRGEALISDGETLLGIFTERDALKQMASGTALEVPIAQVMARSPVTVSPKETVGDAVRKMARGGYRHLPLVDDAGRPTGVVSVSGILHYLVAHFPHVVYNLPPSPHHRIQSKEGA